MPLWQPNMDMVNTLTDDFGIDVFDAKNQRKHLSPAAFKKMNKLMNDGQHSMIDVELANQVAVGMKAWATSRGATHWTHWFQPLTGLTAEKHDSFIGRKDADGHPILDLTGELLIRMEPDASSFPSGGLRQTCEARGYTIWDPVSPAFLMHYESGSVLYIPSAFVSWTKVSLDNKMPLIKSEGALSNACVKMLNTLGDDSERVYSTLGCEQEFFMLDRKKVVQRPDLLQCGRTLQGAEPAKGQDLDDHYFNVIPRKVMACLQDMERQLWCLGIPVMTRHNEVSPAQHEFAPLFEATSVAADHQSLMMNVMKAKALEHGFDCNLHEKPFQGLNGSGKHNNWSVATDQGTNLLNPPEEAMDSPKRALDGLENTRFMVFLAATIKAVDDHAGALRCAIANHGQDFRLGANEAPPAIISVYLGGSLQDMIDQVIQLGKAWEETAKSDSPKAMRRRMSSFEQSHRLPSCGRDRTDRNRTSPFAFTGNKFEFRAVGSSQNVAVPVTALNCALACALEEMHAQLDAKVGKGMSKEMAVKQMVVETLSTHYRVMFNGDGYSPEWVIEAAKRGLPNYATTTKALLNANMVDIYTRTNTMNKLECDARRDVILENYVKAKQIEVRCLVQMCGKHFVPSAQKALARMGASQAVVKNAEVAKQITTLSELLSTVMQEQAKLKEQLKHGGDIAEEATFIDEQVCSTMEAVRVAADQMEDMCTPEEWNLPTYHELIFLQSPP